MIDRTPPYLKLAYEKWFEDHPEGRGEMVNTTVREQRHGKKTLYVKNSSGGDVEISKEEFDARYWARERDRRLA